MKTMIPNQIATQKNRTSFQEAEEFINNKNNFILATHIRTDGDDLGSMLAMTHVLEKLNKKTAPAAVGGIPKNLLFLPKQNLVTEDIPTSEYDGIILFGCCDPTRTHIKKIIDSGIPILNIDHHPDNQFYGQVNIVDINKSSVAELMFDFIKFLKVEISPQIACCLLTGIITDTGSFMHANTTAETLKAASELLKYGAHIEKINKSAFRNKNPDALKAWGKAIENIKIGNNAAVCVISEEDLQGIEISGGDTFNGFADILNAIPEIDYSLFIKQDGELIKGSIRSNENKNVNVSEIAKIFGGGGHKLASGFAIKGRVSKAGGEKWKIEPVL